MNSPRKVACWTGPAHSLLPSLENSSVPRTHAYPLFKHAWCREAGVDPDKPNGHPAAVFGGAFVLSLVAAAVFAVFLGAAPPVASSVGAGLAVGLGWVATSFGINYLFAGRSLS